MMDKLIEEFEKIKDSKDPIEINEYLIELGENPKKEHLVIIDYFTENCDSKIFSQIKLNLIYVIGEIGLIQKLDTKFLDFMSKEYYNSDRWVRNEILSALNKIANHTNLSEKIFDILNYAMIDDYLPISINVMRVVMFYQTIPDESFKRIFQLFRNSDLKLQDQISHVLHKFIQNESHLFDLLNFSQNYKIFNKKAFRSLLLAFFNSALSLSNLESFRELLESSEWESNYKEMCLREIDTYQKLLLRSI